MLKVVDVFREKAYLVRRTWKTAGRSKTYFLALHNNGMRNWAYAPTTLAALSMPLSFMKAGEKHFNSDGRYQNHKSVVAFI